LGFVEKNRDELPKEATELLRTSENPFIQHLAEILTGPSPAAAPVDGSGMAPIPFRRSDSSVVSSVTVGGQFRRQLKDLRLKIDQTSPHYVRCLKPNDHLVPNHFDPLIVAEQLKCGGILEAVRVSRAGYTQHYPHADFVRRYRCLAVKELKRSVTARASRGAGPNWGAAVATPKKWTVPRNGAFQRTSPPGVASGSPSTADQNVDQKAVCTDLLKVIYNKIQAFELDESKENIPEESPPKEAPPTAKAKSYEYKVSTPPPAWSKTKRSSFDAPSGLPPTPKTAPVKSRYQPWVKPVEPTPTPAYRSSVRQAASADFAKTGIQMGKTKVFLRHKAFETLERIRSRHLGTNATKLHAVFRMYLARMAYVPIRDAYRQERRGRGFFSASKEHKEEHPDRPTPVKRSNSGTSTFNLIEQFESQFRLSIHNPVLGKMEAGTDAPAKNFKWMLLEGLWVKNPVYVEP
jgi:Myosin head (motor domain)